VERERHHLRHQGGELGENGGIRSQAGQVCFKFSPVEENNTSHFNPLEETRIGTPWDVSDAQNVAEMIVNTGETNPYDRIGIGQQRP